MIDYIVFDVDGTLTDGGIFISDDGTETKQFHSKDGLVMRTLPQLGFTTIFITGRNSKLTVARAEDLCICEVFQGVSNKKYLLENYMAENNISSKQIAYVGDDLNDYAAMMLCGFKACPADGAKELKTICDYVSPFSGGHGAVRDICEHLLRKMGKYDEFLAAYGIC